MYCLTAFERKDINDSQFESAIQYLLDIVTSQTFHRAM